MILVAPRPSLSYLLSCCTHLITVLPGTRTIFIRTIATQCRFVIRVMYAPLFHGYWVLRSRDAR
ncbi:hypothetical protein WOLCODRAFT_129512, partial [Wolfiporia cocos MD-104 SS10]